jgi:hypothetical protein
MRGENVGFHASIIAFWRGFGKYTIPIQLLRSSIALGSEASRRALGFLLWLHGKQSDPMLRPFVSCGALLLQIQEGLCDTSLLDTCTWVDKEENSARQQLGSDVYSAKWLLGLNGQQVHRRTRSPWTETLAEVMTARSGQLPPEVESTLRLMRDLLSD